MYKRNYTLSPRLAQDYKGKLVLDKVLIYFITQKYEREKAWCYFKRCRKSTCYDSPPIHNKNDWLPQRKAVNLTKVVQ